jgi:GNAT superfamily N-acetyltransferase
VQLPPHRKYPSSEAGAGHSPVTTSLALDRDDKVRRRPHRLASVDSKFRAIQEWWYLALLGVEPAWQGRGVGSALLTHHAQMVAPEGVPLALNTQCEQCVSTPPACQVLD